LIKEFSIKDFRFRKIRETNLKEVLTLGLEKERLANLLNIDSLMLLAAFILLGLKNLVLK